MVSKKTKVLIDAKYYHDSELVGLIKARYYLKWNLSLLTGNYSDSAFYKSTYEAISNFESASVIWRCLLLMQQSDNNSREINIAYDNMINALLKCQYFLF